MQEVDEEVEEGGVEVEVEAVANTRDAPASSRALGVTTAKMKNAVEGSDGGEEEPYHNNKEPPDKMNAILMKSVRKITNATDGSDGVVIESTNTEVERESDNNNNGNNSKSNDKDENNIVY